MKKRFLFEYKISGAILIVLILVSIIGVYTYQRYSNIVEAVNAAVRPDMHLVTIKALRNDLSDAENSIKSYSLTQDPIFMVHFDDTYEEVDEHLAFLFDSPEDGVLTDSMVYELSHLIDQKFEVLNQLLSYQNKFEIAETMDKVSTGIEEVVTDTEKVVKPTEAQLAEKEEEEKKKKRWQIFKRNKDKEKEEEEAEAAQDTLPKVVLTDELLTDVNQRIDKITKEEIDYSNRIIDAEIELILEDRVLTDSIRGILDEMEILEMEAIAAETEHAKEEVRKTNIQVAIFCVAIGILLFFMGYTIINYVRNNNRYRKILAKAKKDAENLADAKARFIANMSHEIRTPMNAIAGFTEQLAESPLNTEQADQLNVVRKSTDHLLHLINEILDLSKLQNNKLKLEQSPFYPADVIGDIASFFEPKLKQSGLKLEMKPIAPTNKVVLGDAFRLRQILLNLVGNAVKFTPAGTITIHTKFEDLEEGEKTNFHVAVEDTGIGMNEEQLNRVFEEFEQAEITTTKSYGGTGLGLAITKQLIEIQEGQIEIKSTPDKGTIVSFVVPYMIASEDDIESIKQVQPKKLDNLAGKRILIVDDEPFNRKLLVSILKKEQAILSEASNGEEAIEALNNSHFHCVLMDMRMPVMDGVEATKFIRSKKDKWFHTVPVIALTAAVTEEDQALYDATGMDGFVSKPFKKNTVIQAIFKTMEGKGNKREQAIEKKVDFAELREISGDSNEFYCDLLDTFLEGTSEGIEGLEQGLKNENWLEMAEWAHRICSPCKHLQADFLYELLKKIENAGRSKTGLDGIPSLVAQVKLEASLVMEEVRLELNRSRS